MAEIVIQTRKGIPRPSYKMTEIGEIPEEWEVKRLGDVAKIIMGQSPPSSSYNEIGNGLAFLQGNIDFGSKFPTKRIFCSKPAKVAWAGDVLVTVRAPVGAVNMAQEQYCIGRGVSALRADGVDAKKPLKKSPTKSS